MLVSNLLTLTLLPFLSSLTLAHPPTLLPRSSPLSPTSAPIPNILALPGLLNKTTTDPLCRQDGSVFYPPARADCDALLENILLGPGALWKKRWRGSGTTPVWQRFFATCRAFLFAADPAGPAEDVFQEVELAVVGARILKACVGPGTPGLGGEGLVGSKKGFALVIAGLQSAAGTGAVSAEDTGGVVAS